MPATLLELENISKLYGPKLIFKNLNLRLGVGELLLLGGANGVGKSTLLRLMAGLTKPTGGSLRYGTNARPAYLGHATWLYPDLTAWENLDFWAKAGGFSSTPDQIDEILELLQLSASANQKTRHFSRGMAQKLNFGRIFLLKPSIILLDEPFTGIDSTFRQFLQDKITDMKKQGAAIVLVSHHLESDMAMADAVGLIRDRQLSFQKPEA